MAYTTPSAPATGFLVTAAFWLAQITNNVLALIQGTSTVTTTGTQTALAIPGGSAGLHGDLVIFLNNASLLTVQGITAGFDGQELTLYAIGAGQVDIAHQNASATAANRLVNHATSGNTSLAAGSGVATYRYDATASRWRLQKHEQGAWITPTYSAGDYTGNASMTWTVDSGDVTACRYCLSGRSLKVAFELQTTSVGGTLSNTLQRAIPGGFSTPSASYATGNMTYNENSAGFTDGLLQVLGGTSIISLFKAALVNWVAVTNNSTMLGEIEIEVA